MVYMDTGLKNHFIHDRLASEMNWYQETDIPEWMTKGKSTLIEKDLQKRIHAQQPQTHNVPTDDVENNEGTNLGGNIQFANKPRTVPLGTERMLQRDQK